MDKDTDTAPVLGVTKPGFSLHCHNLLSDVTESKAKPRRKIIFAACLCFVFMVAECVGGQLSGSMAVFTDGVHLFTDFTGYSLNLFALYLGSKSPSKKLTFGWHRAEVLGALTSVLLIWAMTAILCYLAILRMINEDFEIKSGIMVVYAATGVAMNLLIGLTLSDVSAHIANMLSKRKQTPEGTYLLVPKDIEGETVQNGTAHPPRDQKVPSENINLRAAFIHVLGDCIQSIVVLISALIIYFKPEYKLADPICTIVFTVVVFSTTILILKTILLVIMEGAPTSVNYDDLRASLLQVPGVHSLHNLRVWTLTSGRTAMSVHVSADDANDWHQVVLHCSLRMRDDYDVWDITIQVERYNVSMATCGQCVGLES